MKLTTVPLVVMLCGLSVLYGAKVQEQSIDLSELNDEANLVTNIWHGLQELPVMVMRKTLTAHQSQNTKIGCQKSRAVQGGGGQNPGNGGHPSYRNLPEQEVTAESVSVTTKVTMFSQLPSRIEKIKDGLWRIYDLFVYVNFEIEANGQLASTNDVGGNNAQGGVGPGGQTVNRAGPNSKRLRVIRTKPTPVHAKYSQSFTKVSVTVDISKDKNIDNGQVVVSLRSTVNKEYSCDGYDGSSRQSSIIEPECKFICDTSTTTQHADLIEAQRLELMEKFGNCFQLFLRNYEKDKTNTAAPPPPPPPAPPVPPQSPDGNDLVRYSEEGTAP